MEKGNLAYLEDWEGIVYNDGELAFFDNIRNIRIFDFPVQFEFYVIVLVTSGRATVKINGTTYEAKKDDLFICPPNNIVDGGLMSIDFQGNCICISSAYLQRIVPLAENSWDIKVFFENNPICTLQPEEAKIFCQYYDLLCSKAQYSSIRQKKVIETIVLALIYDMHIVLSRVIRHNPRPFTSREALFKRFVDLLESTYPRPRSVSYYAERLNITPKYFSSVCKQVGGQKATAIIDQYVVKDIVYLMNHTQKSIKEIACELEFPNLSFFGKYVKKYLGVSPKIYREQVVKKMQAFKSLVLYVLNIFISHF